MSTKHKSWLFFVVKKYWNILFERFYPRNTIIQDNSRYVYATSPYLNLTVILFTNSFYQLLRQWDIISLQIYDEQFSASLVRVSFLDGSNLKMFPIS